MYIWVFLDNILSIIKYIVNAYFLSENVCFRIDCASDWIDG